MIYILYKNHKKIQMWAMVNCEQDLIVRIESLVKSGCKIIEILECKGGMQ